MGLQVISDDFLLLQAVLLEYSCLRVSLHRRLSVSGV